MNKTLKNYLIGTGLSIALMLGSAKLTCSNYNKSSHYSELRQKVAEENPNTSRMYSLRRDLFFYFSDKNYDKLDKSPIELAAMSEEFAKLSSDPNNRKDFEEYLRVDQRETNYIFKTVFSSCGIFASLGLLVGLSLNYRIEKQKKKLERITEERAE